MLETIGFATVVVAVWFGIGYLSALIGLFVDTGNKITFEDVMGSETLFIACLGPLLLVMVITMSIVMGAIAVQEKWKKIKHNTIFK